MAGKEIDDDGKKWQWRRETVTGRGERGRRGGESKYDSETKAMVKGTTAGRSAGREPEAIAKRHGGQGRQ